MHFDGSTYTHDRDGKRLGAQYLRVFHLMRDGKFRTLSDIRKETGDPESSVSARLRDMRKERFGGFQVERRYVADGLYEYKLVVNGQEVLKDEKPKDVWIKHDGTSLPVEPETLVMIRCRDGWESKRLHPASYWKESFVQEGSQFDVLEYKIVATH